MNYRQITSCLFLSFFYAFSYLIKSIIFLFTPNSLKYKNFSNDIVLITGGASGFGKILAIKFAALGSKVILWDINKDGLEETKETIKKTGGYCETYVCDISNSSAVYSLASQILKDIGIVTILINNAAIVESNFILKSSDTSFLKTFEVNLFSHYYTAKAFLPSMMSINKGHIVSISSIAGLNGLPYISSYAAAKSAVISLQETLMYETHLNGYDKIYFTTVCPSIMNTPMIKKFHINTPRILPILDPAYVADKAIEAILFNKEIIFIPRIFCLIPALKLIFPIKLITSLMVKAFGLNKRTIKNYVDRVKNN